jgi:endonuclease/exonuclease/phosphatase family metal-dependent hydrolase
MAKPTKPSKGKNKKSSRLYTIVANIITGFSLVTMLLLCLSVASTYISPEKIRLLSLAGLAFPIFLGGTVFMFFISLLFAWRRSWIPLMGLLLCSTTVYQYFPINFPSPAPKQSLKVMTYNTAGFGLWTGSNKSKNDNNGDNRLVRDILRENPDIVGYQEGFYGSQYHEHVEPMLKRNGMYHKSVFSSDNYIGCISRYPIIDTDTICKTDITNAALFKIKLSNADTLYFVVTHLKTMNLTTEERQNFKENIDELRNKDDNDSLDYKSLLHLARKVARASEPRAQQADIIAKFIAENKHRNLIICGDFNDTPVSYTYNTIINAGNLEDAFVQTGNGLGRTFNRYAMVVRIDHILYSKDFWEPHAARIINRPDRSDHNAVTVHLKRKKN